MMQAANLWDGDDWVAVGRFDFSRYRSVAFQRKMSSWFVIAREVREQNAPQMGLVENDDVVETLAAYRADDSLHVGSLPWRSRTYPDSSAG